MHQPVNYIWELKGALKDFNKVSSTLKSAGIQLQTTDDSNYTVWYIFKTEFDLLRAKSLFPLLQNTSKPRRF